MAMKVKKCKTCKSALYTCLCDTCKKVLKWDNSIDISIRLGKKYGHTSFYNIHKDFCSMGCLKRWVIKNV